MASLSLTDIVANSDLDSAVANAIFAEIEDALNGTTAIDIDIKTGNFTTGGKITIDVDGTAVNAAGSLNFGTSQDFGMYFDGSDMQLLSATGGINITPAAGSDILLDGTISIDAGVITGATSITSTAFVGNLTGNCSGTAATVTGAAQAAITSLGTLTTLTVDNITINGSTISHATAADLVITATAGNAVAIEGVSFDGTNVSGIGTLGCGAITSTGDMTIGNPSGLAETLNIGDTAPAIMLYDTDAGVGLKGMRIGNTGGIFQIANKNDGNTGAGTYGTILQFNAGTWSINGAVSGITTLGCGAITSTGQLGISGVATAISISGHAQPVISLTENVASKNLSIYVNQSSAYLTSDSNLYLNGTQTIIKTGTTTALTIDASQNATFAGAVSGITDLTLTGTLNMASAKHIDFPGGVFIGNAPSVLDTTGVIIGYGTGQQMTADADGNVAIGNSCLSDLTTGDSNVAIGNDVGGNMTAGSNNVMIGLNAGNALATGDSNNVMLGAYAGKYETAPNSLYIDSLDRTDEATARTNSLIYGVFDATVASQELHINAGTIDLNGAVSGITTLGASGVVTLADTTTSTSTTTGALKVAGGVGIVENLNVGGYIKSVGIIKHSQTTKTNDYTASTEEIIFCDATSNVITITLPAVSAGLQYTIKKIDSSANAITIDGNSAEEIDGETTQTLTTQYDVITIVSDGTEWFTI